MKIKKLAQAVAISATICLSMPTPSYATGIPVIDVASIAQAIEQLVQLQQQFSELQAQTGLSEEQLRSLTGARGLADLVNDPSSRYYIPSEYQDLLKLTAGIEGGDYNALQNRVGDLLAAAEILNLEETGFKAGSKEAKTFVSDQNQIAINGALAEAAYDEANLRTANLQTLLDRINSAEDPKEIADLQARISAEQLMLSNEQIKLAALSETQETYWERQQQRSKEERLRVLGNGTINIPNW
jgi:type IV secretion system protein VirB5|tara:strand:- start:25160 stop:25885 length:726 start_codon:yes stop_codon:yes gene_type:complete